jgi:phosphopantothenoylcysteine decarboxylase
MANVLLGVTGSVAAVKTPELARKLEQAGHVARIVATEPALYFFDPADLRGIPLFRDADEWPGDRYERGGPVLHIELRRWAEVFVIAPLDANTLAKLAGGLADNCLTCVWRAWDPARPVVLAPAMNTLMWEHPLTVRHLRQVAGEDAPAGLDAEGLMEWINRHHPTLRVVPPVSKLLACGDTGVGALAAVDAIVAAVG